MFERVSSPATGPRHGDTGYEYLVVTVHAGESLSDARALVAERTEYGRWELARTIVYLGGSRRYWLRRRVMRVTSTLR